MANIKVAINPPDVKSLTYNNTFKQAGQQIPLQVKTAVGIKLNPAAPTTAVVITKVEVGDEEKNITFNVELFTGVTVSTFVDNLDEFIKKNYMGYVMTAVNEKIRSISAGMGLAFKLPVLQHEYRPLAEDATSDYLS